MIRRLGTLLVAAALVWAGGASAGTVRATLTASTHSPAVGSPWDWTVVVKDGAGKPLRAKLKLQILFGRMVVGCWKAGRMAPCTNAMAGDSIGFVGRRAGVIRWTADSRGAPLTFQAVVRAGGKTTKLRYPVTVK
jgi:hypothetical protein